MLDCNDWGKHYIGETQHNLHKMIYEHRRSIKSNDDQNAFFSDMFIFKDISNFLQVILIKPIYCRNSLCLFESAIIPHSKHTIKQNPGFFPISPYQANIILRKNNIRIDNG